MPGQSWRREKFETLKYLPEILTRQVQEGTSLVVAIREATSLVVAIREATSPVVAIREATSPVVATATAGNFPRGGNTRSQVKDTVNNLSIPPALTP
jgi:hypothetical protein